MHWVTRFVSTLLIWGIPLGVQATDSERSLKIFNWQYYLSEEVISLWEQETNIKIEQIYFDNDRIRDRTISRSQYSDIDIAILDEVATRNFSHQDKLHNLSQQPSISNQKHISPRWREQCSDFAVPYFWGTLGMIYRKDQFPTPSNSWAELLYPKPAHQGNIAMMADYTDLLMPSLFIRGLSILTSDKQIMSDIYNELVEQIPSVRTYQYLLTYIEQDPSRAKDIHLALGYSGDEVSLNKISKNYEWGFSTPDEGTVLWVDCLVVLKHSQQTDAAFQFINFLHRPDIAAMNAISVGNATTNTLAKTLINKSDKEYLALYPNQTLINKSQFYSTLMNTSMLIRSRISNAVVQQHEKMNNHD